SKSCFHQISGVFSRNQREKNVLKTFFSESFFNKETSFAWAMARPGHSQSNIGKRGFMKY
ncbi:MAG TPA: hypothetical protein V6C58_09730, partial [Allocoleopsis sp.]